MISWKTAKELGNELRPDLKGKEQKEVARIIFLEKNLCDNGMIAIVLSFTAIIVATISLLK